MSHESDAVRSIVPDLYQAIAHDFQYPPNTNVAATNQCHVLTKGLNMALANRGIESRRELHINEEGLWHYVIAHTPLDAQPAEDDLITDLNPWQFMDSAPGHYTFLHAPRAEVMEQLARSGAPDYFVALRGLATIAHAHTDVMQPKIN